MVRTKAAERGKARPGRVDVTGLIVEAVSNCTEKSGMTMAALHEALTAGGYDAAHHVSRVKRAVKKLVSLGTLLQSKGPGAVYFMLNRGTGPSPAAAAQSPKKAMGTPPRTAEKSPERTPKKGSPGNSPKRGGKSPKKAKASPNKVKGGRQKKK